ncbi:MAG TPA: hypothetical protein VJ179_00950, partial [Patescibacteria group bacterium]|nr:hypothetical protein [Patescibacteria group bacterium]
MKRYAELKFVVLSFLVWRASLFLIAWLASSFLPLRDGFLGCGTVHYRLNPILCSQANFDGVPYLMIAERGYGAYQQAFFPLYPLLVRNLSFIFDGDLLKTGLV